MTLEIPRRLVPALSYLLDRGLAAAERELRDQPAMSARCHILVRRIDRQVCANLARTPE
jgi:hypothetical protein